MTSDQTRSGDAGRVLIVDDSRAIRRILGRTLAEAGYEVLEAGDGQEGIDVARREAPDLMLLDVDMPVLDGLSAMRRMSEDPQLSELPVLFLSARTSGGDAAAGLGLGAKDYLRKPCEPEELLARVGSAIAVRRQQKALLAQAQQLDDLSATDPLTGLGNRRRFDLAVAQLQRDAGPDAAVAVAIADLDHFKAVNDQEGHLIGDTVLTIAARRIRSACEAQDTVVRWGGEEFLVLRAGARCNEILRTAERIRAEVAASTFSVGVDHVLGVTISVGCAVGTLRDLEAVTRAADEALYAAKDAGRNRALQAD